MVRASSLAAVLLVGSVAFAGSLPTEKQVTDAQAKHAAATQRASDAYRKAVVAADQAFVDTLTQQTKPFDRVRVAAQDNGLVDARRKLVDASLRLKADQQLLAEHAPVPDQSDSIVQQERRNAVRQTPMGAYDAIKLGAASEQAALSLLAAGGWAVVGGRPVVEDNFVDGKSIHRATYTLVCGGEHMTLIADDGVAAAKTMP